MDRALIRRVIAVVIVAVLLVALAWFLLSRSTGGDFTQPVPAPEEVDHPVGGNAKVAVLSPPEPTDQGNGGRTLRSLVYPHLFVSQPDGSWRASLVEPGTDKTSRDARTATFALRGDARWNDGSAITVDDLRRNADGTWVDSLEGPDDKGVITLRLTNPLPDWRRLWSGDDYVEPASDQLFGGPYVVRSTTSGLQTQLQRNPDWYGTEGGPFLEYIDLVIAADAVLGRQLLSTGQVDVFGPPEDTVRTEQYRALDGVETSVSTKSGRWTALRMSANNPADVRGTLALAFPRADFTNGLLHDEATVLNSFIDDGTTWSDGASPVPRAASNRSFTFSTPVSSPLSSNLQRAGVQAFADFGQEATPQTADDGSLRSAIDSGEFGVAIEQEQDPRSTCWTCSFSAVDRDLAIRADGGDQAAARDLEQKLRNEAWILPLWRANAVAAWRPEFVDGVEANGYNSSVAWNAQYWWRP